MKLVETKWITKPLPPCPNCGEEMATGVNFFDGPEWTNGKPKYWCKPCNKTYAEKK